MFSGSKCGCSIIKEKHNWSLSAQQRRKGCEFNHQNKMGNTKVENNSKSCPCENIQVTLSCICSPLYTEFFVWFWFCSSDVPHGKVWLCLLLCWVCPGILLGEGEMPSEFPQIPWSGWLKDAACICRVPWEWTVLSIFTTRRQFLFHSCMWWIRRESHCVLIKLKIYILNKEVQWFAYTWRWSN